MQQSSDSKPTQLETFRLMDLPYSVISHHIIPFWDVKQIFYLLSVSKNKFPLSKDKTKREHLLETLARLLNVSLIMYPGKEKFIIDNLVEFRDIYAQEYPNFYISNLKRAVLNLDNNLLRKTLFPLAEDLDAFREYIGGRFEEKEWKQINDVYQNAPDRLFPHIYNAATVNLPCVLALMDQVQFCNGFNLFRMLKTRAGLCELDFKDFKPPTTQAGLAGMKMLATVFNKVKEELDFQTVADFQARLQAGDESAFLLAYAALICLDDWVKDINFENLFLNAQAQYHPIIIAAMGGDSVFFKRILSAFLEILIRNLPGDPVAEIALLKKLMFLSKKFYPVFTCSVFSALTKGNMDILNIILFQKNEFIKNLRFLSQHGGYDGINALAVEWEKKYDGYASLKTLVSRIPRQVDFHQELCLLAKRGSFERILTNSTFATIPEHPFLEKNIQMIDFIHGYLSDRVDFNALYSCGEIKKWPVFNPDIDEKCEIKPIAEKFNAIFFAACSGNFQLIKFLLDKTDLNHYSTTYAIVIAVQSGYNSIAIALIEQLKKTFSNQTEILSQLLNDSIKIMKRPILFNSQSHNMDIYGVSRLRYDHFPYAETPMISAAKKNNVAMIHLLLEAKATLDVRNHLGEYPINHAVKSKSVAAIICLLKIDKDGQVAFMKKKNSRSEFKQLMQSIGAVKIKDDKDLADIKFLGKTCFDAKLPYGKEINILTSSFTLLGPSAHPEESASKGSSIVEQARAFIK